MQRRCKACWPILFIDNALTFKLEHLLKAYEQQFESNVWAKLHLLAYELQRANYEACYPLVKAIMRRTPDSAQGHVLAGRYFSERPYVDEVAAIYHFKKAKALGLDNPGVNALPDYYRCPVNITSTLTR